MGQFPSGIGLWGRGNFYAFHFNAAVPTGKFCGPPIGSQGSFPKPLSAQEERLALEQAAAGDRSARDRLIEHNLRLVAHIVKKYYTQTGGDSDDLISIGTVGLIKAVNTYNAEKKIKLATYAARCIENEILMYLRKTRRLSGEVSLNDALDQEDEGECPVSDGRDPGGGYHAGGPEYPGRLSEGPGGSGALPD